MKVQGDRAQQDRTLDALIAELLRVRAQDPSSSNDAIRNLREEGRP